MLETLFVDNIVFALVVWCVIYAGDYYLTLYGARLYHANAREHLSRQGSYELTPLFRQDIDAFKPVSARFLAMVAISVVLIAVIWILGVQRLNEPEIYLMALGALLLREGVVYLRHWRNIVAFRLLANPAYVSGKIEYSRAFSYKTSSQEFLAFAAFYLVLTLTVSSWFIFGGCLSCLVTGLQHWNYARKQPKV